MPIAEDFVHAMRQIKELDPVATTVQLYRPLRRDAFTQSLSFAMERAGYGVRWVEDTTGSHFMQYRREQELKIPGSERTRYDLAVGDIEFRRTYRIDDQGIGPLTPLYIKGAEARHVVLDDRAFQAGASFSLPMPVEHNRIPDEANPLDSRIAGAIDAGSLTLPLVGLPAVQNVFELGGSNFENRLAGYHIVSEQILTFPNDSLRLGTLNKQIVENLVMQFQRSTDLFSVIGCSMGPTKLKSGNAALALGRASRVREALMFAGVAPDRILDEGCWAGDGAGNALPRRGVVITLNRQR
jgi:hypothetical protein